MKSVPRPICFPQLIEWPFVCDVTITIFCIVLFLTLRSWFKSVVYTIIYDFIIEIFNPILFCDGSFYPFDISSPDIKMKKKLDKVPF